MPSSPNKLSPALSLTPQNFNIIPGRRNSSTAQISGTNNPVTLLLSRTSPTNDNNNNDTNFDNLVAVKESGFIGDQVTADINNNTDKNNATYDKGDNIQNNNFVSPYYRGLLTNESVIYYSYTSTNLRQKSHAPPKSCASSRASLASTIFTKFKGLGNSCYRFQRKRKKDDLDLDGEENQKETSSAGLIGADRKNIATVSTTGRCSTNTNTSTALSLRNYYYSSSSIITTTTVSSGDRVDAKGREEKRNGGSNGERKPMRESKTVSSDVACLPDDDHRRDDDNDRDDKDDDDDNDDDHGQIVKAESVILEDRKAAKDVNVVVGSKFSWADKYQPEFLEEFICNESKANQLQVQARNGKCGHYIFQGPPGVGKRTMIWAMIREAFAPQSIQATDKLKVFKLKGEMVESIEVGVKEGPLVMQVNISELKGYEKHILRELIMENASIKSNKTLPCEPPYNCRAIIVNGVDKLSTDAILYIQWLMERYEVCNKIFFCCEDLSKLQPITKLCTVIHLQPPSKSEIIEVLKFIASKEGIELPIQLATKIADGSKNNLRQAIRSFEATWIKHYPFEEDQEVLTGWEDDIANIAKDIVHEQSPRQLYVIRGKLENLVEHEVSPGFIFQSLVTELKKHVNDVMKHRIHLLYRDYSIKIDETLMIKCDKMMAQTRKDDGFRSNFLGIEEFIAKFMSCLKTANTTHSDGHAS